MPMPETPLNVVLVEPEIPQNTGNIARTCLAAGARLHLVGPLGFSLDAGKLRRAGMDYWDQCDVRQWPDFASLRQSAPGGRFHLLTTKVRRAYWEAEFRPGDWLVFGRETRGLPASLLKEYPQECLTIPMMPGARSLNLATAAGLVLYEAVRQVTLRARLVFLALAFPCSVLAQSALPDPGPPAPVSSRIWSPQLPAGACHVLLRSILAVSLQDYDTVRDGATHRTLELSVETSGGQLLRFLWMGPAERGGPLPSEMEEKRREVEQAVQQLTGTAAEPPDRGRLRKEHPFTTHSRITEFRLPTASDVRTLYDDVLQRWSKSLPAD